MQALDQWTSGQVYPHTLCVLVLELLFHKLPDPRLILLDHQSCPLVAANLDVASDIVLDRLEGHASEDIYSWPCQYHPL